MFPVAEKTDMGQSISEMELKDKAKKENEGGGRKETWMNLEGTVLREIRQKKKNKCHMVSLIGNKKD